MTRRRYADVIHAWAEGAEIEFRRKYGQFNWVKTENPEWDAEGVEFRIKPKEPEWWENIPEHGILCWVSDRNLKLSKKNGISLILKYNSEVNCKYLDTNHITWYYATPLTNEEIKEFIR